MCVNRNQLPISQGTGTNRNTVEGLRSLCIMAEMHTEGPEQGGANDGDGCEVMMAHESTGWTSPWRPNPL